MTEPWIRDLQAAAKNLSDRSATRAGIQTLGELREALRGLPAEAAVFIAGAAAPTALMSYRGYYDRLAFDSTPRDYTETKLITGHVGDWYESGCHEVQIAQPATVAGVLRALSLANGREFEGYKGGQFLMDDNTFVHAAPYGSTGLAVVGVKAIADGVLLLTAEEEW